MRWYPRLITLLLVVLSAGSVHAQLNDIRLWGVSQVGPVTPQTGFIYSVNPDGTDFINHKTFESNPDGTVPFMKMIKGSDGFYYGTTKAGGTKNGGVIYRINADGTGYTKIFEFDPTVGYDPTELTEGSDGKLYGGLRSSRKLFSIGKDGNGFNVIYTFLTDAAVGNGFNYGVIQGSDGFLYGTTYAGGATNNGAIYKIRPDGTQVQKVFDLTIADSHESRVIEGHDGLLYWMGGVPNRLLSRVDKSGNQHQVLHDLGTGSFAHELIQLSDNTLLGMVPNGSPGGLLFKIQPDGSGYQQLYSFTECTPLTITLGANGKIYGAGNDNGPGMIFRIDINGSNFTVIRTGGTFPDLVSFRGLVETTPGNFLGIADGGAVSGNGAIFTINDAGTYSLRKEFPTLDGVRPATTLLLASDGNLYGTTETGGQYGAGTIFRIAKDGSAFTKLYDFEILFLRGSEYPRTGLIESGGFLFGARPNGVFRIAMNGSGFTLIHFNLFPDNTHPYGNLLVGQDGAIYGVKASLTNQAVGFVYKVNTNGTGYTEILNLSVTKSTTGSMPTSIVQLANGDLLVTTATNGPSFSGTTFTMKPDGSDIVVLRANDFSQFTQATGNAPLEASDGLLYGTTFFNEPIFSIKKDGTGYTSYPANFSQLGGSLIEITGKRIYGVDWGLVKFDMETKQLQQFLFLPISLQSIGNGLTGAPKQSQTVTLDAIDNKTFGEPAFIVGATSSLDLPITYTSSNTDVATVDGNVVTLVAAGSTIIKAYQPGSITISDASDSKTLTVSKISRHVAISSFNKGLQGLVVTLTANLNGHEGAPAYSVTNGTGAATVDGDRLTLTSAGTVTINLEVNETSNYTAAEAHQLFTIDLPPTNAAFLSPSTGRAGGTIPVVVNKGETTGSMTIQVENISGSATLNGNTLSLQSPGKVKLIATISAGEHHSPTTIVQIITINNADGTPFDDYPRIVGTAGGGKNNAGVLFQVRPDFTSYAVLNHFEGHPDGGAWYQGQLLDMGNGDLYGTVYGAAKGAGAIFKYTTTSDAYSIEYVFEEATGGNPAGYLVRASDGNIYGFAATGGSNNAGVLYSFDPVSKVFTRKVDLNPANVGNSPRGGLVEGLPGLLHAVIDYGGANNGGTIVEYNISTGVLTPKHAFAAGSNPNPYLTKAPNGKLYGLTGLGGDNGEGVIFEFDPTTGAVATKVHLHPQGTGSVPLAGLALAANGKLYGHTNRTIIEYVPGATTATAIFNTSEQSGYLPFGNMFSAPDGKLYGMPGLGAANNNGKIFRLDPNTHDYSVRYSFHRVTGGQPYGTLVSAPNGKLYGMTGFGGAHGAGVLFEFDPSTSNYTVRKNFIYSPNGSSPGNLHVENDRIYGLASGGTQGLGVFYEYKESTGQYTKKIDADAYQSFLVRHPNGKLYAANASSVSGRTGSTIFEVDPAGAFTALTTFPDFHTITSIIVAGNGKFYGTARGGATNDGIIFEFDPVTNTYKKEFDFTFMTTGIYPIQIAEGPDGFLYGTTQQGGPANGGVFFRYDYNQAQYTSLHNFGLSGPNWPAGKIAFAGNGKAYGLLQYGGQSNKGAVYEVDLTTHDVTVKKNFDKSIDDLGVITFNNKLIGAYARQGDHGSIFEYDIATDNLQTKFSLSGENGSNLRELMIVKGNQSITFNELPAKTLGDAPFALSGISSSGLPLAYSTTSDEITIATSQVTLVKAGRAAIKAQQNGDAGYHAALPVDQSFCINPAKPAITLGGTLEEPVLTSSSDTGNQWYRNGIPINAATNKTFNALVEGAYTVKASADDCVSEASVPINLVITGINEVSPWNLLVYPNPAKDEVNVELRDNSHQEVSIAMIDGLGRVIQERLSHTNTPERFTTTSLSKGIFYFRINMAGRFVSFKFEKQ